MNKLIIIVAITLFISCNPIQIKHVSQLNKLNKPSFVFALPKTVLTVNLIIEKQIILKGPYAEFAEKYLGIEKVPVNNSEKYNIKKVEIIENIIADTEQIYLVQYKHQLPWQSIVQQKDGVILTINNPKNCLPNYSNNQKSFQFINHTLDQIAYKELTQSSYIKERIDTVFKQVKIDTNWVRIAVQKKTVDTIKIDDKAKEAAQHILDIRSRLFDLLTGDMETLPQGEAAQTIVEYLKTEEQEYLSMFLGKTYTTTINYSFEINPDIKNKNEYLIAYFDSNKGIVQKPSNREKVIKLQLYPYDSFKPYTMAQLKFQKAQKKNIFPYRLPVLSKISVLVNDDIVFYKDSWIYQFGKTIEVPTCFLKKYSFDFTNPHIISISK